MLEGLAGPAARTAATGRAGETFGPYRLVREVGRGGMGVVYEAMHEPLNKRVALKLLTTGSDAAGLLERFFREARTAAGLHHTNIVPVFDIGQVGGTPYYAMQFIAGRGLDEILRCRGGDTIPVTPRPESTRRAVGSSAPLEDSGRGVTEVVTPLLQPPSYFRWVADLAVQAADGLAYAHRRGIVHRDVKPSNLLLDDQGVLWITDFGLARRADDPALTKSGTLVGTPRYMSPEQAVADQAVDHRTDVYSLGVTLYELLTRRPAFDGPTPLDIVRQILERTPPPPRAIDPAVPRDLETVVLKAMARRVEDRYSSADALADDLRRWRENRPIRARRIGPVGRLIRWTRRNPAIAALTAALFVMSYVLAVTAMLAAWTVSREKDRADAEQYETRKALAASLTNQARVVLQAGRPGRRWEALELIRNAVAHSAVLAPADAPARADLRGLAAEALSLRDVQVHRQATGFTFAASADGRRMARALHVGDEMFVRVIDVENGSERELGRRSVKEADFIPVLAFSGDGERLVMASGVGPPGLTVWDVATGRARELPDVAPPADRSDIAICYRLIVSPDGRRAVALRAYQQGAMLVVWDLDAGGLPTVLNPEAMMGPVAIAPDGRTVAHVTKDGIALCPVAGGNVVTLPRAPEVRGVWVNDLAMSPTRPLLAAALAGKGFSVGLWDIASRQFVAAIPITAGPVSHVAFSPDGERLAVAVIRDGEQVHFVRVADRVNEFRRPTPGGGPSKMLLWLTDGQRLATAVEKDAVRVWEPAWVSAGDSLEGRHAVPTELADSPDGRWRAVGGWDGKDRTTARIRLTHRGTGATRELTAPDTAGYRLVFRSDRSQLAAIARGAAVLWDTDTGKEVARQSPAGGEFVSAAFDPAGTLLAVDRNGSVWHVAAGKVSWTLPTDAGEARLSPDGEQLVAGVGSPPARVSVYDAATQTKIASLVGTGPDEVIDQPRFSPNGRWLFTLSPANGFATVTRPWASLWDAATGSKRHDLTGEAFAASSAFDPAGELLAVGHEDGSVRVWRAETGEDLFRWRPGTRAVLRLTFAADGSELIAIVEGSADLPVLKLGVLRRELATIGLGW
jgi:serine/threonine protein kinase/WD40 repeat protein